MVMNNEPTVEELRIESERLHEKSRVLHEKMRLLNEEAAELMIASALADMRWKAALEALAKSQEVPTDRANS